MRSTHCFVSTWQSASWRSSSATGHLRIENSAPLRRGFLLLSSKRHLPLSSRPAQGLCRHDTLSMKFRRYLAAAHFYDFLIQRKATER